MGPLATRGTPRRGARRAAPPHRQHRGCRDHRWPGARAARGFGQPQGSLQRDPSRAQSGSEIRGLAGASPFGRPVRAGGIGLGDRRRAPGASRLPGKSGNSSSRTNRVLARACRKLHLHSPNAFEQSSVDSLDLPALVAHRIEAVTLNIEAEVASTVGGAAGGVRHAYAAAAQATTIGSKPERRVLVRHLTDVLWVIALREPRTPRCRTWSPTPPWSRCRRGARSRVGGGPTRR